ncbi:MAG: hypothetical protein ACYTE0_13220 [Planctomycetota bacterium]|jgi:hypothetical protein
MLLLTLIALMGLGGVVLVGFSQEAKQQVDHERYLHNKRVLEEAKQALLMYAYNYPVNNPVPANNPRRGPGRLPCPDTSNNGSPNASFDCENVTGVVGRFPWNDPDMNLYDMRDASGERLWYAVSENFANNRSTLAADVVNSDTTGTITIHDQSGAVMYDNNLEGVAAVIIAPGAEIDRNGTPQDRAADINNPVHFLDLFGALDNSDFVNAPSANGFVLGPIFDANGDVIVNDQMILITADELTAVAEKATLEAYRDAIDDYQQAIWGAAVANYRYPWMNAHADIANLNIYDTRPVPGTTVGRVPFLNYYADLDSHIVITDLVVDYDVDLNLIDTNDLNDQTYINAFDTLFTGVQLDISGANLSFKQETFDLSANVHTDNRGTLISAADGLTVVNSGGSFSSETLYFWDELVANGWELCPVIIGDERDCARSGGVFVPFTAWPSHDDIKIRRVIMNFGLDADFEIGLNYTTAPTLNPPTAPTATANARFQAVFDPTMVTDLAVDVDASLANDFIEITIPPIVGVTSGCEQDDNVSGEFNIPSSPTAACPTCLPDGGSSHCTVTLSPSVTVNQLDITADYYPPLPLWVKHNNWNDSILMAYADDYKPDPVVDNDCLLPVNTCLTVGDDFAGSSNTNI